LAGAWVTGLGAVAVVFPGALAAGRVLATDEGEGAAATLGGFAGGRLERAAVWDEEVLLAAGLVAGFAALVAVLAATAFWAGVVFSGVLVGLADLADLAALAALAGALAGFAGFAGAFLTAAFTAGALAAFGALLWVVARAGIESLWPIED
jgi:hypothetical protein